MPPKILSDIFYSIIPHSPKFITLRKDIFIFELSNFFAVDGGIVVNVQPSIKSCRVGRILISR
jgi:hypothetical protein